MKLQASTESYRTEHSFTRGPKIHTGLPGSQDRAQIQAPGGKWLLTVLPEGQQAWGKQHSHPRGTVLTQRLREGRDRPRRRAPFPHPLSEPASVKPREVLQSKATAGAQSPQPLAPSRRAKQSPEQAGRGLDKRGGQGPRGPALILKMRKSGPRRPPHSPRGTETRRCGDTGKQVSGTRRHRHRDT